MAGNVPVFPKGKAIKGEDVRRLPKSGASANPAISRPTNIRIARPDDPVSCHPQGGTIGRPSQATLFAKALKKKVLPNSRGLKILEPAGLRSKGWPLFMPPPIARRAPPPVHSLSIGVSR